MSLSSNLSTFFRSTTNLDPAPGIVVIEQAGGLHASPSTLTSTRSASSPDLPSW